MAAGTFPTRTVPRFRTARARLRLRALLAGALIGAVFVAGYQRTAPAREQAPPIRASAADYRDGTYSGWGRARHGRILATVVIRRGRIASVSITDCRMKYPCSMIGVLPARVSSVQSVDVDIVSGATNSSEAFVRAVTAALAQASRQGAAR